MIKILGLIFICSLSITCLATEKETQELDAELDGVIPSLGGKAIASEPIKPSGIQVTPIPLNTKLGDALIGNKIVDHDKGITCYTIIHVGHSPQLWCTK